MHFVRGQRDPEHPEPTPEQLTALHRRMGPPDNEVPGTIPFHAVLGRTDELARRDRGGTSVQQWDFDQDCRPLSQVRHVRSRIRR